MTATSRRALALAIAGAVAVSIGLAGCASGGGSSSDSGPVTLTWFAGSGVDANTKTMQALADAYHKVDPKVTIKVDATGPSDSQIDNVMKTRLATKTMADMFWYNSGSLLQALSPDQTMLNIKGDPATKNLDKAFVATVSTDKGVYGVPVQSAGGGGIFYNIPIYNKLGLQIPKTWDDFMANAKKIKDAGYTAVEQTYGDPWTSQIVTLADFYNVSANDPSFAKNYTKNKANFAGDPTATASFSKLQDIHDGGYLNKDFAAAKLNDGLKAVATGTAANYPMLGFAQATIIANWPDHANDVGFFGIPGDSADKNGMTVWEPSALYAPANTKHPDAVKKFMAFVASPAGCDAITAALGVTGVYPVKGCTLPDTAPKIIADMLPYFKAGQTNPALEFLSPVKGPNLQQITVEVGTGIVSGAKAAALYDADATKQAQQLGLPGW